MRLKIFGMIFDTEKETKSNKNIPTTRIDVEGAARKINEEYAKGVVKRLRQVHIRMPDFGSHIIGYFIGLMVVVIVAVSVVIPTMTLLNILPLFVVLGILILVVSMMRF